MGRDADQSRSRRSSKRLRASLDEEVVAGGKGAAGRPSLGPEGGVPAGAEEDFYPPEDDMMMDMDDEGMLPPMMEVEGGEGAGPQAGGKQRPGSSLSLGLGLDSVLEEADAEGAQAGAAEEDDEAPPEPVKKRRKTRKPVRTLYTLLVYLVCVRCASRLPQHTYLTTH